MAAGSDLGGLGGSGGHHRAGRKRATHAKEARLAENEANRAEERARQARELANQATEYARQQFELSQNSRATHRVRVRVKREKKDHDTGDQPQHSPGNSGEEEEGVGPGAPAEGEGWTYQQQEDFEHADVGTGVHQPYSPDDPSQQYDPRDKHWVEKSKEMSGLLRYGKHRGRFLTIQHSGWSSQSDLAEVMGVPAWVVPAIVEGSRDFKGKPRFAARTEDGILYVRPFHFQGSKARNNQSRSSWE